MDGKAEIWELLQRHGHVDTDDDGIIIFVQSYYIDHLRHRHEDRPRPLRFDLDHSEWESQVRFIWEDVVDEHMAIEIAIVDPEPPAFEHRSTVATVIVHQQIIPHRFACLITAVIPTDSALRVLESAHSLEQEQRPSDLLQAGGVEHIGRLRQEQGFGACTLHVGWRLLPNDAPVLLQHGLGLIIRVPIPLRDAVMEDNPVASTYPAGQEHRHPEERDPPEDLHQDLHADGSEAPEDSHSLMARRPVPRRQPSSSTTSYTSSSSTLATDWRQTVIFLLNGRAVSSSLPWHDSEELLVHAAQSIDLPQNQVLRVHHVSHRPEDFIQMDLQGLLLQRSTEFRPSPFMRIVLLDLELHVDNDVQPTPFQRRARWVSYATTRQALFRALGLAFVYQNHPALCHLWQNNVLIDDRHDTPLHIADGDYVKILVGDLEQQEACTSAEEELVNVTSRSASSSSGERAWTDSDDVNMLQNQIISYRRHERQIGELVAQTHRPCCPEDFPPPRCKVEEPDIVTPHRFETGDETRAPPIAPHMRTVAEQPHIIQQLYGIWHETFVTPTAPEDPRLEVATWYLDFQIQPICREHRVVHLQRDFTQWWNLIQAAWADIADRQWPMDFYLVQPSPPATRDFVSARVHLIVVQRAIVHTFANIFTIIDPLEQQVRKDFATFAPHLVSKLTIIEIAQYQHVCSSAVSDLQCMAWHADFELRGQVALRNRHGLSFMLIHNPLPEAPSMDPWQETSDSDSLLQISMAQREKTTLKLTELVPHTTAVRIIDGSGRNSLPNPLEVEAPGYTEQVCQELKKWGHDCFVFACIEHQLYLCVHRDLALEEGHHYVFAHDDPMDQPGLVLHSAPEELSEIQALRFLCELGYSRAVILQHVALCDRWSFILFHHREPEAALPVTKERSKSKWPAPSTGSRTSSPLLHVPNKEIRDKSTCELSTSFGSKELVELFQSGMDVLVTDFGVLDLPDELRDLLTHHPVCALDSIDQLDQFDRLLLFTDGSSIPAMRRHLPERADELGHPDTWALIVVAEKYTQQQPGELTVLGWTAQPVRYTPGGSAYTGITRTGSDMAERSGLIGAAMWRLALNHGISTVFCSDSALGVGQAQGILGTAVQDPSYELLRGLFQALELALPGDRMSVHHVRAHTGDLFNEIADIAAKREAAKSFNLPRQKLDMNVWHSHFCQLWTVYGHLCGLPTWHEGSLDVAPPSLPTSLPTSDNATTIHSQEGKQSCRTVDFFCSFASANVQSLYKGPHGHGGKLHFLQEQMRSFGLNFLAIQEARSEPGMSTARNILRLSSGHDNGQYGIEVWCDLTAPYGKQRKSSSLYFSKEDFQVVYADPRRMLLRCTTTMTSFWIFAGHAPHSRHSKAKRDQWWQEVHQIFQQHLDGDPLILLMDANASPGDRDDWVVLREGFATSANTAAFRELLATWQLYLPASSRAHVGPNHTWTSFNGESEHCIDHVALPYSWYDRCTRSQVLRDFDMATLQEDHAAVAVQLEWQEMLPFHKNSDDHPTSLEASILLLQPGSMS